MQMFRASDKRITRVLAKHLTSWQLAGEREGEGEIERERRLPQKPLKAEVNLYRNCAGATEI